MSEEKPMSQNLVKGCRWLALIVLGLTLFKSINLAMMNEEVLKLLGEPDLASMLNITDFYKSMAVSFFLLFLAKLIEGDEVGEVYQTRYLNLTLFFLGMLCFNQVVRAVASGLIGLKLVKDDPFFVFQLSFFQFLDVAYATIPGFFAVLLAKIYKNYRRLEEFEREVI